MLFFSSKYKLTRCGALTTDGQLSSTTLSHSSFSEGQVEKIKWKKGKVHGLRQRAVKLKEND